MYLKIEWPLFPVHGLTGEVFALVLGNAKVLPAQAAAAFIVPGKRDNHTSWYFHRKEKNNIYKRKY